MSSTANASVDSTVVIKQESKYEEYMDYLKYHKLTIEYRDLIQR